jgi:hypothetical protein
VVRAGQTELAPRRILSFGNAGVIDLGAIAQALDNTQLTQFKEAIGKKDVDRCGKLYNETMQGCFACHKASEKPYLVLRRPEAPEVNVINFSADAPAEK